MIEHYEAAHYPIPPPDPIEAIKFRMEQMGLTQADLAKILHSKSRVSGVLPGAILSEAGLVPAMRQVLSLV